MSFTKHRGFYGRDRARFADFKNGRLRGTRPDPAKYANGLAVFMTLHVERCEHFSLLAA